ncbi:MAG: sugar phosphate isomerase/epimerase, partial [Lentisphaeria bacterium]|nr:sugar phosphate isomerase/epimerase [Lentisphaeria bacterium]
MRPTGLLSVIFRHLPFERIIELTAEAGLDGIEWGSDVHVPPGDLKQAEKIGEATRSAGLINFSYGSYWYADTEPEMIAETSAALGARWIR